MKRTLWLRSEPLSELTSSELEAVAGGAPELTHWCPSIDYCEIPTLPVRTCFDPDRA